MTKNYSKSKPQENLTNADKLLGAAAEKRNSRPQFTIKGKEFYIEKWPHTVLWEYIPTVGNLFVVPLTAAIDHNEWGEEIISEANVMTVWFNRLQDLEMTEFLKDITSCVFSKETGKVIDLDKDLVDAEDICTVLSEVLKHSFLFLFNGHFTGMLQLGGEVSKVNQALSRQ